MKTIQTKPGVTLGFWIPEKHLIDKLQTGTIITYTNSETKEKDKVTVIGKLSEITEEQARELVELGEVQLNIENPATKKIEKRSYSRDEHYQMEKWRAFREHSAFKSFAYTQKLYAVAQSIGISPDEFDQYLVIKL